MIKVGKSIKTEQPTNDLYIQNKHQEKLINRIDILKREGNYSRNSWTTNTIRKNKTESEI